MALNRIHERKHGDTYRPLTITASYSDGRVPDFTGATVKFIMVPEAGGAPTTNTSVGVTVDNVAKTLSYKFVGTEPEGTYNAEFEARWGGEPDTFPQRGYITVIIKPDLA